jgi:hypothetical protein
MKFPYNKVLEIRKSYQAGKLSREDAKEQLAYVLDLKDSSDFCEDAAKTTAGDSWGEPYYANWSSYGPLLRLSDVCTILRLWAKIYATPLSTDDEYMIAERKKLQEAAQYVDLQISKSCLLDRLFFQEEGVRTEPCPEHKGRWSGCVWKELPCGCLNGSNVTGWLPNPEDTGYVDRPDAPLCDFCGKPPLKQGLWSGRVDGKHGHTECMDANPLPKGWKPKGIDRIDA